MESSYLHIHAYGKPEWVVGNSLTIGGEDNHYWQQRKKPCVFANRETGETANTHQLLQVTLARAKQDVEWKTKNGDELLACLASATNSVEQLLVQVREIIFEQVRQVDFHDRPSRQRCMWLISEEEQDALGYWSEVYSAQYAHKKSIAQPKLFRIQAAGIAHRAQAEFLQFGSNGPEDWIELATRYWTGVSNMSQAIDEILFTGKVEILEELPFACE